MKLRDLDAVTEALVRAAAAVRFDEEGHTYRRAGERLVSVTQVLRHFFPDDFAHVKAEVLEHKRQIGNAAHLATHLHDRGVLDDATVHASVRPYLAAWRLFRAERRPTIVATELRLAHPTRAYAGTIDKLAWFPDQALDDLTVLDLKTGDPTAARTHLQTGGYAELVRAALQVTAVTGPVTRPVTGVRQVHRVSVRLKSDGTYTLSRYPDRADWRKFAALRDALTVITEESRHAAVA